MRLPALLAAIFLAGSFHPANAETARELLDRAKEVNDEREPKDGRRRIKMTLVDSRGYRRVRELEIYSKRYGEEETKTITFFLSPADVKGVGFLAWAHPDEPDDQWLYLPALKRTRRITASTRRRSFQGSDFSYRDLELLEEIDDWTEEDAATRLLEDSEPAVIELAPKDEDLEYRRIVVWLHRGDWTFRKIELHDRKRGHLMKRLLLEDFTVIDGVPTAHRLEMTNLEKGTKTLLEISDVAYNQGLRDEIFTERTLERGRVNF